ncbi:hypothetical protein Aperf_G00000101473 [Anoplocephala perfoliata]
MCLFEGYVLKFHELKSFQESRPQYEQSVRAHRAGDLQIKAVQFSRPFLYSTSNWRSGGCDIDIGSIIPKDEILYGHVISSALRINDSNEKQDQFSYIIKDDTHNGLKVKFELNSRTEVTPLYLNIHVAFDEATANPISHQDLLIFPQYVKNPVDVVAQSTYGYSIQLRFPPLSSSINNKESDRQGLRRLSISIRDCLKTQKVQLLMFSPEKYVDTMMLDGADSLDLSNFKIDQLDNLTKSSVSMSIFTDVFPAKDASIIPYLVLFFATLIIVVVLMIVNTLSCLIKRQKRNHTCGIHFKTLYLKDAENLKFVVLSGVKSKRQDGGYIPLNSKSPYSLFTKSNFRSQSFSCAKEGILVSYISFRVFYSFIFTFSVALSIFFSFWPPVDVESPSGTSLSIWSREIHLPLIQREAARRESDTEKVLFQHSMKAAQFVHACQDVMIRQIVDVARELDRTVQEVLDVELSSQKSENNMFKMMEALAFHQMADLNLAVQDYITHLRAELDTAMMSDVVRFSELLSSIYVSQWLLFVKRMMNSSHIPWDINTPDTHFVPTPEHLNSLRLKISNIEFARQFGLAEAENFLFIPSLITSQLEDLVLSKVPSKILQPNFIASVLKENENSAQSNSDQTYNADPDVFKPLVLRSFTNVDDLDVFIRQQQQDLKSSFNTFLTNKPSLNGNSSNGMFSLHLPSISLGQLRFILFLIDCYLIATRFYNTYIVLREILTDKRLVVDASSYISALAALPMQKHLNGDVKMEESQFSSVQEEMHYRCGHSLTSSEGVS